ncbi:MAG: EamA family transporter [Chloroflexi bacterium]|nr:EamA family transporter [Chloroflexota bacterium]
MSTSNTNKVHLAAVSQALLVTFLWSTSWVLIKIGLKSDLPAITFAGLRYTLAFFCLLPLVVLNRDHRQAIRELSTRHWVELCILGIIFYTLTQGAQFVSLSILPAATLNLILNFSPIVIAMYGLSSRHESTSIAQWGGILLTITGVAIYFLPLSIDGKQIPGLIAGLIALLANSGSSVFGRYVNSQGRFNPIIVTTVSMGVGGILMLVIGIFTQGIGTLDIKQWAIIGWLALVNTALAFTLWNKTLQTLTAVESSIINGTMLPQIAILAWIFLGEPLGLKQIIGVIFVGAGTLIVQLWRYFPISKI